MTYRTYNNRHHMMVNNCHNQYLLRDDCYKFSTLRFDESLVGGRTNRAEVQELIDHLHHEVRNFS